jgi:hypothetical protein
VTAAGSKGLLTGVTLQGNPPSDIPLVAMGRIWFGLYIGKPSFTEMKGVVQLAQIFKGLAQNNVVESILNWVHGKNVLADILGDGPDASNNHCFFKLSVGRVDYVVHCLVVGLWLRHIWKRHG